MRTAAGTGRPGGGERVQSRLGCGGRGSIEVEEEEEEGVMMVQTWKDATDGREFI